MLPSGAFQWLVVLGATIISAAFTLQSTYRSALSAIAVAAAETGPAAVTTAGAARLLLLFIVAAQVAFGVCLKLFFFRF